LTIAYTASTKCLKGYIRAQPAFEASRLTIVLLLPYYWLATGLQPWGVWREATPEEPGDSSGTAYPEGRIWSGAIKAAPDQWLIIHLIAPKYQKKVKHNICIIQSDMLIFTPG